jgi:hypothetical protein
LTLRVWKRRIGVAVGVTCVRVTGGGGGSHIIGVLNGVTVLDGGGAGSQMIGVLNGVTVLEGGGGGSQMIGVLNGVAVLGGGGGSHTIGGQHFTVAAPPHRTTNVRMVFCKSAGNLLQGTMLPPQ